jgi:hypothetical protein
MSSPQLAAFAKAVLLHGDRWCTGIDGASLQDLAVTHGLVTQETVAAPCDENCLCARELGPDCFPVECFQWTPLMRQIIRRRFQC